jgi:hypothetical protein
MIINHPDSKARIEIAELEGQGQGVQTEGYCVRSEVAAQGSLDRDIEDSPPQYTPDVSRRYVRRREEEQYCVPIL